MNVAIVCVCVCVCTYVRACVHKEHKSGVHRPSKVILVGHSMGGFVARALFLHPKFQPSSVDTIITLSSPHRLNLLKGQVRLMCDRYDLV